MTDVLLIHPAEQGKTFGSMPPLGMAWITSYLQSNGISTELVDLQISEENVESIITKHKPKIVGIGGTSHTRYESFSIAKKIKEINPVIKIIYGGSHATFTAENTLSHIPEIDIIIRGEGEIAMRQTAERILSENHDLTGIRGISYRNNSLIVHNKEVERIKNLDILPFPYRDPEAIKRYNLLLDFLDVPAASVITSRGCPVNCSFCSASAMFGTQLTFRSAKNVVDEIEILLKEYNYRGIKFFDSTFTLNKNHVEAICAEIERRKLKFPWECEIRANGMSFDLLRIMRNAGCYYVDFGVESASQSVLKTMHKGITIEQVENIFRWTKELGIYTKVFFTFGHIEETYNDACATVEFMERNAKYISVAATGVGVRIYPGTEVERYAFNIGCLKNNFSWSKPYEDSAIESLGNDPLIPILIQPQFGWREFRKIEFRLARFWIKNPGAALKVLWGHIKFGRGKFLVRLVVQFIKLHIFGRKSF